MSGPARVTPFGIWGVTRPGDFRGPTARTAPKTRVRGTKKQRESAPQGTVMHMLVTTTRQRESKRRLRDETSLMSITALAYLGRDFSHLQMRNGADGSVDTYRLPPGSGAIACNHLTEGIHRIVSAQRAVFSSNTEIIQRSAKPAKCSHRRGSLKH